MLKTRLSEYLDWRKSARKRMKQRRETTSYHMALTAVPLRLTDSHLNLIQARRHCRLTPTIYSDRTIMNIFDMHDFADAAHCGRSPESHRWSEIEPLPPWK